MIQCHACEITHPIDAIYITNHNMGCFGEDYNYIYCKDVNDWKYVPITSIRQHHHWHLCKNEYLCSACFIIKDIIE